MSREARVGVLVLALGALACGRGKSDGSTSYPSAVAPAPDAGPEPSKTPSTTEANASSTASPRESAPPTSSPAPPPPPLPRRAYRVAALGDSITDARVGGGGYLKLLEKHCPESRFENFGKGGDMTNQMRRRFESEIAPRAAEFDTLLFYGGVNDLYSDETAGRTNARIEHDVRAVFLRAKGLGLRVVVLTVSPWGGLRRWFSEKRGESTRLLNGWFLGLPFETPSPLVDVVVDTYPLLSCGVPTHLCPEYQRKVPDGIHPGPKGHEILGQAVLERAFADCR